jgi:hypothetical protein
MSRASGWTRRLSVAGVDQGDVAAGVVRRSILRGVRGRSRGCVHDSPRPPCLSQRPVRLTRSGSPELDLPGRPILRSIVVDVDAHVDRLRVRPMPPD